MWKNILPFWKECVILRRYLTIIWSLFHGVMAALEFLVLSVPVRIGVEQLIKKSFVHCMRLFFIFIPLCCQMFLPCMGQFSAVRQNRFHVMQFKLDYNFEIDTELLHFRFVEGRSDAAYVHTEGKNLTVTLPQGFNFSTRTRQEWANRVLVELLRKRAQQLLPARLAAFARQYDLRYERVTIKNVNTRWGSCSSLGNINLSLWLMLAPLRLVDYVIKHELAHLNEMNHGPRFWAEVDRMTGGKGCGKLLEAEMKAFARELMGRGWRR